MGFFSLYLSRVLTRMESLLCFRMAGTERAVQLEVSNIVQKRSRDGVQDILKKQKTSTKIILFWA